MSSSSIQTRLRNLWSSFLDIQRFSKKLHRSFKQKVSSSRCPRFSRLLKVGRQLWAADRPTLASSSSSLTSSMTATNCQVGTEAFCSPLLLLQILENDWIEINRSSFHYLGKWIDIWAFYLFLSWQQLLKNGIIRLKSTKSFGHVYVKLQFLLLLWKCRWIWKWFWWFEVIFGSSLNPKIAFPTNNGKFTSAAAVTSKSDRHLRVPSVTWTRADGFAQTIFGLNRVMISLLVKNGLP